MKRFLLASSNLFRLPQPARVPVVSSIPVNSSLFYWIIRAILVSLIVLAASMLNAQTPEQQTEQYKKVIAERADKIVKVLAITDSGKYQKVLNTIMNQYFDLNTIHEENKTIIATIKKQSLSKEETDEAIRKQDEKKSSQLLQLHTKFLAHLKENLTEEQVEKVKDGMTYRVMPVTWAAYLDMLPRLTDDQKNQIYTWLKEARELAMDAESSEKKHAVFGKYKGKINNYLSAAGYDMKKEGEEWQKRIKERQQQSVPSNPSN